MHRVIRDHLEEVLAEAGALGHASGGRDSSQNARTQDFELHLRQCDECRTEIEFMRKHAALLRQLRSETEVEPRPGFYARVMSRVETHIQIQGASIWSVFSESPFGKRIAVASMMLALVFGIYVVASEQFWEQPATEQVQITPSPLPGEDQPGMVLGSRGMPDREAVLVNLVTYREQ